MVEDVADPVLGTGEVIVDMAATNLPSYAAEIFSGERKYLLELPAVPGAGGVGRVRAFGPDATRLAVGDWVYCDCTVHSRDDALSPDITLQGVSARGEGGLKLQKYFHWGKNRNAVAAATSDARAAAADAAEARLTISTAVAATYADLARLYAERDVAERSAASREETLDLASRRVTNGLDTQAELKQAAAGVPAARAELAALDEQIGLTRNALAALMGQGPDRGLAITRPAQTAPKAFGLPERLAADLIGRRPDVVAAKWRAEAASRRIGVAKAAFYPNVNLAALIGYEFLGSPSCSPPGSDYGQYGAAVSLPIFEGGKLRADLHGARADYDAAVASYDATLIQALREVADAATSQRALAERLKQSREALADDEAAYKVARLRYEGGLANYQSVLLAEDAVLQARRDVVDLEFPRLLPRHPAHQGPRRRLRQRLIADPFIRTSPMPDSSPAHFSDQAVAAEPDHARPASGARLRLFGMLGGAIALVALIVVGYWLLIGQFKVTTDNAYVDADTAQITPQITGQIAKVNVAETQPVKAGRRPGPDRRHRREDRARPGPGPARPGPAQGARLFRQRRGARRPGSLAPAGIVRADAQIASAQSDLEAGPDRARPARAAGRLGRGLRRRADPGAEPVHQRQGRPGPGPRGQGPGPGRHHRRRRHARRQRRPDRRARRSTPTPRSPRPRPRSTRRSSTWTAPCCARRSTA